MNLTCMPRGNLNGSEAAYALLGHTVGLEYGIALPEILKTPAGKPFFPAFPEIHFSVSHTKTHVLCAVSDRPVGVDVETARPVRPGVPDRVCTPEELEVFDFFELWVLKESYIKLTGNNGVILNSVCFSGYRDHIVTPDSAVGARLYGDVPGCFASACTGGYDFPMQITMIPPDAIFPSNERPEEEISRPNLLKFNRS